MLEHEGLRLDLLFISDGQHERIVWKVYSPKIAGDPHGQCQNGLTGSSRGGNPQFGFVAEHVAEQVEHGMPVTRKDISVQILRMLLPQLLGARSFSLSLWVGIERRVYEHATPAKPPNRLFQLLEPAGVVRYPDVEDDRFWLSLLGSNYMEQVCKALPVPGWIAGVLIGMTPRQIDQNDVLGQPDVFRGIEVENPIDEVVQVVPEPGRNKPGKQDDEDHQVRTQALEPHHRPFSSG